MKGYPNASFRAFATEQEARSFVTGNAGDDKRRKATVRKLYAVRRGRQPGLYNTWGEVEEQVRMATRGIPGERTDGRLFVYAR